MLGACLINTATPNGVKAEQLNLSRPVIPALLPPVLTAETLTAEAMTMLEGPLWQLTSYASETGETIAAQTYQTEHPTVQFQAGRVGGNATCNRFFGTYELTSNALTIQPGGSTLMACPPEYMAQEQAVLAALGQVASYTISDGRLRLKDTDGKTLLTLTEFVSPSLTSTLWEVVGYNNGRGGVTSGIAGTRITATFDTNGGLTGFAGCNTYLASYERTDGTLSIGSAISTRKFCSQPEGVMAQETAYLQALETAASYTVEGNGLTLKNASGETVARFRAADAPEGP